MGVIVMGALEDEKEDREKKSLTNWGRLRGEYGDSRKPIAVEKKIVTL